MTHSCAFHTSAARAILEAEEEEEVAWCFTTPSEQAATRRLALAQPLTHKQTGEGISITDYNFVVNGVFRKNNSLIQSNDRWVVAHPRQAHHVVAARRKGRASYLDYHSERIHVVLPAWINRGLDDTLPAGAERNYFLSQEIVAGERAAALLIGSRMRPRTQPVADADGNVVRWVRPTPAPGKLAPLWARARAEMRAQKLARADADRDADADAGPNPDSLSEKLYGVCEAIRAAFRATAPTDHFGRLRFAEALLALRQTGREAYLEWRLVGRAERTALRRGREVVNLHRALYMRSGLDHVRASYAKIQDILDMVRHTWQRNAKNYGAHGGPNPFPACVGEAANRFRHEKGLADQYYTRRFEWMMTTILRADERRLNMGHVGLQHHEIATWMIRYRGKLDLFFEYVDFVIDAWKSEHDRLLQTEALRQASLANDEAGKAFVEAFDIVQERFQARVNRDHLDCNAVYRRAYHSLGDDLGVDEPDRRANTRMPHEYTRDERDAEAFCERSRAAHIAAFVERQKQVREQKADEAKALKAQAKRMGKVAEGKIVYTREQMIDNKRRLLESRLAHVANPNGWQASDVAELRRLQVDTDAKRREMGRAERQLQMVKLRYELYNRHFESLETEVADIKSRTRNIAEDLQRLEAGDYERASAATPLPSSPSRFARKCVRASSA